MIKSVHSTFPSLLVLDTVWELSWYCLTTTSNANQAVNNPKNIEQNINSQRIHVDEMEAMEHIATLAVGGEIH
jgi:hypothetical protein